jgi:uncharacterized protein
LRIIFYFLLLAIMISSCNVNIPQEDPAYLQEIETWHKERIKSLTSETGWLTLAGLFWLEEGENSFGCGADNGIVFPKGKAPDKIGAIVVEGQQVTTQINKNVRVFLDSTTVSTVKMTNDAEGQPTILKHGSLNWYIIKRGNRLGVRLKDSENPIRTNFQGIDRFPVKSQWRILARYKPYESPKTIKVPTVTGMSEDTTPGLLEFVIKGKSFTLEPLGSPDSELLFIIFGDQTNGKETYGGGRFLYIENPGKAGEAIIDFNKSYNPPCVFTPYATCPMPTEQNMLDTKITAGEKTNPHSY